MTVNGDTSALSTAQLSGWDAAKRGENDGSNPPRPSTTDMAWEVVTIGTKSIAGHPDYRRPAPRHRDGVVDGVPLQSPAIMQPQHYQVSPR